MPCYIQEVFKQGKLSTFQRSGYYIFLSKIVFLKLRIKPQKQGRSRFQNTYSGGYRKVGHFDRKKSFCLCEFKGAVTAE